VRALGFFAALWQRSPALVFFQIFGDVLGKKNVPGVAAIHHSLCDVDSSAREIGPLVYIKHAANGTAVDSHPKLQARMFLECAADLHRALHRRFRIGVKDQHHPIASWDPNQTVRGFGSLKLFGGANNSVQFLNRRVLLINRGLPGAISRGLLDRPRRVLGSSPRRQF
jgi:hypothetical protein